MTRDALQPSRSPAALVAALQSAYQAVTGKCRSLDMNDRLEEDLNLDSVDCLDILALVDDHLRLDAFDQVLNGDYELVRVGDVVAALAVTRGTAT